MAITTPLTELFQIRHPILLAPMAFVSGGALAAAVSAAGGLGLIGGGYGEEDWLERELARADGNRFGVGFITWSLARSPRLLDLALSHRPAAVMLSFGDPAPFAETIKASGATLVYQVQTVAQAREAVDLGAELIVAQGTEAGGHSWDRSTLALVPAVVDTVAPIPVVAAGGIGDGRGLAAALMLGAAGVLVGTRFFASDEALGGPDAKRRIVEASGDDTVRTTVFDRVRAREWPAEFEGRALANDFSRRWHGREAELDAARQSEGALYAEAAARGEFDTAVIFAGEVVDLIRAVEPAGAIVERMVTEAEIALASHVPTP